MDDAPGLHIEHRADGCTLLHATATLAPYPERVTERLAHWADRTPNATFLAEQPGAPSGDRWSRITYRQTQARMRSLAQALLGRGLSADRPVLILSGNGIDHALLALACQHVGIPYAPVSVAYALASSDHKRLREIVALTTPGLIFAAGPKFRRVLDTVTPPDALAVSDLAELGTPEPTEVDAAHAGITGDTIAKFLFTSGSTSTPKAVINTHRMLCSNQAMLEAVFPFLAEEPPILVDWLPWSHTFGSNHNFNLIMFHGGTLHIDPGRPVPGQFEPTIQALREIAPTLHMAVPKAWEELAGRLEADPALNRMFHSRLRVPFYAAASLPQPLWDRLAALSVAAIGRALPMVTGLGSTETAPMALCTDGHANRAGHIGLPVAGMQLKLAPMDGKLEVRLRGPNVTPGYWRDPARTAAAFDDEGYYCMGDAAAWIDPTRPEAGLRFDGRLAEDFKLMSGTWVSVGPLRARLIAAMAPYVRDVIVAGHNRDEIAVLALLYDPADAQNPAARAEIAATLSRLAADAPGSAARVVRLAFLADALSADAGELTDKGSVNQAAVLRCRPAEVEALYAAPPPAHVICAETVGAM